ncbi:hypothetical protein AF335_21435 [Streptomyces eurocidicus]|uniref:Lipoprotein n=1 Tax=Streptomyces eurocidicus TaxID=66423 RepID=A0A2N8NSY4_STREU|nr:hypothetical protein [Streptomyces eurocidicus]MBB5120111.1 hypothetical protein [Streptomyces eurocidicus]MBF6056430.1 hypothetical protein [Streptomyces eurocidicus]PNE31878.1 hypothetical protein AF335_21435 [Streptomyces eurocidicus]
MHVHPRRIAVAALAASTLLLATACDSGSGSGSGSGTGATSSPGSKAKPSSTPAPLTPARAKDALLAATDLPTGWKLEENAVIDKTMGAVDEMLDKARAQCTPLVTLLNTGRPEADYKSNLQQVFVKQGDETNISQDVSGYTREQAEKAMATLRTAVGNCSSFTATMNGKKATVTVKKLDVAKAGDDSLGFTVTILVGEYAMDFDFGTVRSRGAVTTVRNNWGAHGDRGKAAFTKGLAKAAEKLTAAAAGTA